MSVPNGVVNIASPNFDQADSYGRIAHELSVWLQARDVHVNEIGYGGKRRIQGAIGGILLGYPTNIPTYGNLLGIGPRIIVTMFESTALPDGWADHLNQCDAVIVPSHWLVPVFQKAGVTTPIYVVPLGISDAFRQSRTRPAPDPLTFLAIADRGGRKGWHIAGFAFQKAFGDDTAYRLIYKCRRGALGFRFSNPNIDVIETDLSNDELADLYGQCHVMLFPSCGEGFGLPPREFAATDGLALATDWGGTADDLPRWGLPIPASLTPAWPGDASFEGLGLWAKPDVDHLADSLLDIAAHYSSYQQQALGFGAFARQHYTWSTFAESVWAIWEGVRYGNQHATQPV